MWSFGLPAGRLVVWYLVDQILPLRGVYHTTNRLLRTGRQNDHYGWWWWWWGPGRGWGGVRWRTVIMWIKLSITTWTTTTTTTGIGQVENPQTAEKTNPKNFEFRVLRSRRLNGKYLESYFAHKLLSPGLCDDDCKALHSLNKAVPLCMNRGAFNGSSHLVNYECQGK